MLISSQNTPTHIWKQYFTTLVQSCWYICFTMTVLKEHRVWWRWERMVDRINSVMKVSTESKHRSNLGFPKKVTPNLDLIWKDRFGMKRQILGLRGKRTTCKLKEQKKQKLEDKIRRQGWDYGFTPPFSLSMIRIVCYFLPSTELNSRKKLVTNTYGFLPVKWRRKSISREQT